MSKTEDSHVVSSKNLKEAKSYNLNDFLEETEKQSKNSIYRVKDIEVCVDSTDHRLCSVNYPYRAKLFISLSRRKALLRKLSRFWPKNW